jgi:hypothetical protein
VRHHGGWRRGNITGGSRALRLALIPALVACSALVSGGAASAAAKSPVSWSPASVSLTVAAGRSTTSSAAFTSSKALSNVTVAASSGISGSVTPAPGSAASVTAGTPVTVSLSVSIPRSTVPGTYIGAIKVSAQGKNIARPLPVTINVTGTCTPGTTGCPWQTGDLTTYTQNSWTVSPGSTTLTNNFSHIYTTGSVKVGGASSCA